MSDIRLGPKMPELEGLWQAAVNRDTRYDKTFVFGARATGIYCRALQEGERIARGEA